MQKSEKCFKQLEVPAKFLGASGGKDNERENVRQFMKKKSTVKSVEENKRA